MSRREESIPYMLVYSIPWWVSVVLAGVVYSLMRWVAPDVRPDGPMLRDILKAMPGAAGIFAMPLLGFAGLNLLVRLLRRKSQQPREASLTDNRGDKKPGFNDTMSCPACGGKMVNRTAKRGANIGARFWGCVRYPACHGTRSA